MIIRASKSQNILIQWFQFQFFDMPKGILIAWGNFLAFNFNYFSVPLLLKTYFSHWHRYRYSYGRGFDIQRYFEAFTFNAFSRVFGALFRTFFIILGIVLEVVILTIGAIIFIGWFVMPIFFMALIFLGIKLIFF